jgi:predicted Zn-dependent protease
METLTDLAAIEAELARALSLSPADETEIVWSESWTATTSSRTRRQLPPHVHRTVAVRVIERGRLGSYRTLAGSSGELDDAVRQALAQARIRPPLDGVFHLPRPQAAPPLPAGVPPIADPAVAALDVEAAGDLLRRLVGRQELARLTWGDGRFVVRNSRGLAAATEATAIELVASCGPGPGAGRAERATRRFERLDAEAVVEEARSVHADGPAGEPAREAPLVLSTAASGALLGELNRVALTASAYREPLSLLRERRGAAVFHPRLSVRDDATSPAGLPFPFDLEGTPKRPVDLVVRGVPQTPALDQRQAATVGLAPTGHSISGDDARAENLFVLPGESSLDDLLGAAEGGLWVGWLEGLVCVDPLGLRFRARARGARRIAGGKLAEAVRDLVWEDSLLRVLGSIEAVGRRLGTTGASLMGVVCAPRLAIAPGGAWS